MINDNLQNRSTGTPELSLSLGTSRSYILNVILNSVGSFQTIYNQPDIVHPLNENKLTQIFLEQIEFNLKRVSNIGVKNQYYDIFSLEKGIPDFYFHYVIEGQTHKPIFVFESKILPTPPPTSRKKEEYVLGDKNNGGIERFKLESHGKGITNIGLLGFVKRHDFIYWNNEINNWIKDLAVTSSFWNKTELLTKQKELKGIHCSLESTVKTKSGTTKNLNHIWIKLPSIKPNSL